MGKAVSVVQSIIVWYHTVDLNKIGIAKDLNGKAVSGIQSIIVWYHS
jgi:hypothetical protein